MKSNKQQMMMAYQHGAQMSGGTATAGMTLSNQGAANINYVAQKYQPLINNAGIISPSQQNNQYFGTATGNGRGYSSNGNRATATIQNPTTGNMIYHPGQQQILSGIMTPTGPPKNVFAGTMSSGGGGQQRKNSRPSNATQQPQFVPSTQPLSRADSRTGTKANQMKQRATSSSKRQQATMQINNINIRGNFMTQMQGQPNQKEVVAVGRRAYSNLRGAEGHTQDILNGQEGARMQARGGKQHLQQQRTVSRPRQAQNDSGQFATIDGVSYPIKMNQKGADAGNAHLDLYGTRHLGSNIQSTKNGNKNFETIQQQMANQGAPGIIYQNSAKINPQAKPRGAEESPKVGRDVTNHDGKKAQLKGQAPGSGFVDTFKTNICKEQAKRLIFSNSNAFIESENGMVKNGTATAEKDQDKIKAKMRKKNIDLLDTNHQLLVEHRITESNMQGSHQYAEGIKTEPRGRHTDQGRVTHGNSKKNATNGQQSAVSGQFLQLEQHQNRNDQSLEKDQANNVDQTRTDDLAASSPTIEELQTQQDIYRFGKHSGALIVASATSDFSQVSENGADGDGNGAGTDTANNIRQRKKNDIKIMTGAYSLNKNSVVNDQIFTDSFMKENQHSSGIDQDHFYGIPQSEGRAFTQTTYQNDQQYSGMQENLDNSELYPASSNGAQYQQQQQQQQIYGNQEAGGATNANQKSSYRRLGHNNALTQNNSQHRMNNGSFSQMSKNGKKNGQNQKANGGAEASRTQARSNPRPGMRGNQKNTIPLNPHLQLTAGGKAKAHSTLRNAAGAATINPTTQALTTPTNAYGLETNTANGGMVPNQNNEAQRFNQNQTQIQRNNYLVAQNNAYQKGNVIGGTQRDVKNNTDLRPGTIAQGNNILRWQYANTNGAKGQRGNGGEQGQGTHDGQPKNNTEPSSSVKPPSAYRGAAPTIYTQVSSPLYKQQNYPGIPKTTTNQQQRGKSGGMIAGAGGIQGGGVGGQPAQNYNNLYGQKQNLKSGGAGGGTLVYGEQAEMEEPQRQFNTIMATSGNQKTGAINGNLFHQKRQTQFQMKGQTGILSDNHLISENSVLDANINKDVGGGIQSKKTNNKAKGLVFTNRQKSGKSNSTMRGGAGGDRSMSNVQGNIQTISNIQAIDNFIDNQISIKTPVAQQPKSQATVIPGGQYYNLSKGQKTPTTATAGGTAKTRAITQIRKNSQLQTGQKGNNTVGLTSPVRGPDLSEGRQMFSALQNPTGPPLDNAKGTLMQIKGANYGAGTIKSGGTLENKIDGRSPDKIGFSSGGGAIPAGAGGKNNFFIKVTEKKNDPHGLNSQNGYDNGKGGNQQKPQIFENKKLSQSYVVYHQMKKNLMQSNGVLGRGSRYQPGALGAQSPVSDENFDDQFLQLDNTVNKNPVTPFKDDPGMNALEQALQDHLNKEKYDPQSDTNFDKYHLRIKKVGNQQISENKTAATNSSGGNYMNFRSKKLVIRTTDKNNMQLKSAEDDQEHERQRMELSALLCSSINDFSSQAIKKNRLQKVQKDVNAGGNTKISNQNALLSLLSQEDFTDLKKQIHGKITDVTGQQDGNDDLIIQERNDENDIKVKGTDIDLQSQGILSQAENI